MTELRIVVLNKNKKTNKELRKWPNKINVQVKGTKSPSITGKTGYIKKYMQH